MEDDPKLREECGVLGIYYPGVDVARLTFFGQFALQHRGQESAGIAVWKDGAIKLHKGMGLVQQVFHDDDIEALKGSLAIGHNRYSTTGSSELCNAGPFVLETETGPIALSHNGNIVSALSLRSRLEDEGINFESTTDTEVLIKSLAGSFGKTWVERIMNTAPKWQGAFCLTIIADGALYGVRDPLGIRPLCLGRINDEGWVIASESSALYTIGANFVRDIEPGEIVQIDDFGVQSFHMTHAEKKQAFCIFEYIYLARPDSVINGKNVYQIRKRLGEVLAEEYPVEADLVIPVPDSGVPAAIGYAERSGIPYGQGLIKNRYIGRTFIQPDQKLREQGISLKLNALKHEIEGKRLVLVDDSIVRGNTTNRIVALLKKSGAKEVHLRISAPPIVSPCYFGLDIAKKSELIAARLSVDEIQAKTGAESLGYISLDGLVRATGLPKQDFCLGCFTGSYPIPIQMEMDKLILEE
ncbi:MAG: amidophosphoribosyltransferase [bacterium]